jgi:hypothetical protein
LNELHLVTHIYLFLSPKYTIGIVGQTNTKVFVIESPKVIGLVAGCGCEVGG